MNWEEEHDSELTWLTWREVTSFSDMEIYSFVPYEELEIYPHFAEGHMITLPKNWILA